MYQIIFLSFVFKLILFLFIFPRYFKQFEQFILLFFQLMSQSWHSFTYIFRSLLFSFSNHYISLKINISSHSNLFFLPHMGRFLLKTLHAQNKLSKHSKIYFIAIIKVRFTYKFLNYSLYTSTE